MTDKRVSKWAVLSGLVRRAASDPVRKRRAPTRHRTALVALLLGLGWMVSAATWQPPELDGQEPAAAEAAADAKPERAKPRGRLPAYYSRVVTPEQRAEIYDIQGKFNEQIEQLQMQLQTLIEQRDSEVEMVLTEEQRKQVAAYVEEARARQAERRRAASPETPADSAETEPAASEAASDTP